MNVPEEPSRPDASASLTDDRADRDLYKAEYLQLQSVIEAFDERALTIKAWSVTFSLAAVAGAYASKAWPVLVLAAVSAVTFWLIEGFWKTFQFAYYKRSYDLEAFFANERQLPAPFQIGRNWDEHWKKGGAKQLFRIMLWPHVALPHVLVLLVALVLVVLHFTDILPVSV